MAYSPNINPNWPLKPVSYAATLSAGKTSYTDAANLVTLVAADNDHPRAFGFIYGIPQGAINAGKLMLFFNAGGTITLVDEQLNVAQTPNTTTLAVPIIFPRWTNDNPLYLPEGVSLGIASSVAQAGGIVCNAIGVMY
jgi:hypothetical protein